MWRSSPKVAAQTGWRFLNATLQNDQSGLPSIRRPIPCSRSFTRHHHRRRRAVTFPFLNRCGCPISRVGIHATIQLNALKAGALFQRWCQSASIPVSILRRPTFCALALTSTRSELGLGACRCRPRMSMPRSASRQSQWRSTRPPAPARPICTAWNQPALMGLPRLAVAIFYAAFKYRHPVWAATFGAERHISTGATLRIRFFTREIRSIRCSGE
jgi:hypothetical protein